MQRAKELAQTSLERQWICFFTMGFRILQRRGWRWGGTMRRKRCETHSCKRGRLTTGSGRQHPCFRGPQRFDQTFATKPTTRSRRSRAALFPVPGFHKIVGNRFFPKGGWLWRFVRPPFRFTRGFGSEVCHRPKTFESFRQSTSQPPWLCDPVRLE